MVEYAAQVGAVLEAFGNCETTQNDNSSRFVKLLQVRLLFIIRQYSIVCHIYSLLKISDI